MWQLGEHRLICGDCTDAAVVERVMVGERADLVTTDPPYNLEIGKGGAFSKAHDKKIKDLENIMNFDPSNFLVMLKKLFVDYANFYIFCNTALVPDSCFWARHNNFRYNILTWHKKTFIPAGGNHHYPDTEYIIYISKNAVFNSGLSANYGKYFIENNEKSPLHPTIKPIDIIENQVKISSNLGKIVADFYSGSGTTIIACENLGRKCRAVEISPAYVAVALERWSVHAGKTPVLIAPLPIDK